MQNYDLMYSPNINNSYYIWKQTNDNEFIFIFKLTFTDDVGHITIIVLPNVMNRNIIMNILTETIDTLYTIKHIRNSEGLPTSNDFLFVEHPHIPINRNDLLFNINFTTLLESTNNTFLAGQLETASRVGTPELFSIHLLIEQLNDRRRIH